MKNRTKTKSPTFVELSADRGHPGPFVLTPHPVGAERNVRPREASAFTLWAMQCKYSMYTMYKASDTRNN